LPELQQQAFFPSWTGMAKRSKWINWLKKYLKSGTRLQAGPSWFVMARGLSLPKQVTAFFLVHPLTGPL